MTAALKTVQQYAEVARDGDRKAEDMGCKNEYREKKIWGHCRKSESKQ